MSTNRERIRIIDSNCGKLEIFDYLEGHGLIRVGPTNRKCVGTGTRFADEWTRGRLSSFPLYTHPLQFTQMPLVARCNFRLKK